VQKEGFLLKRIMGWTLALCVVLSAFAGANAVAAPPALERSDALDLTSPVMEDQFLIVVSGAEKLDLAKKAIEERGGIINELLEAPGLIVAQFPGVTVKEPAAVQELFIALKQEPAIVTVDFNHIVHYDAATPDPLYVDQYGLDRINAPTMWNTNIGKASTAIAIVDSGVRSSHEDLSGNLVTGAHIGSSHDRDDVGHGTHVAGIAAAVTENGLGVSGTCPECSIMPVKIANDAGAPVLQNIIDGIYWAADHGADVINLSLGTGNNFKLRQAVEYAWQKGVFLSCAAGNDNSSAYHYPAAYENCMAVAATNGNNQRWVNLIGGGGSNYGDWVEVAAPGFNILSTYNGSDSDYAKLTGTSMAAPFVAGYAGLLDGRCWGNQQIWDTIMLNAKDIGGKGTLWSGGLLQMTDLPSICVKEIPLKDLIKWPDFYWRECMCLMTPGNWIERSRRDYELISKEFTRGGEYAAWLGGYNAADDRLSQIVSIPEGGSLTYSWYQSSREESLVPVDVLTVRLRDAATGRDLATLATHSNTDARDEWMQESIDLSAFAGQTVTLEFSMTSDSVQTTSFVIDQVSLK
jgi:thermitase